MYGGGVSLPSGVVNLDGMTFTGTTSTGGSFSGVIRNRVQKGYSPVDGYGFINAQTRGGGAGAMRNPASNQTSCTAEPAAQSHQCFWGYELCAIP